MGLHVECCPRARPYAVVIPVVPVPVATAVTGSRAAGMVPDTR